MPLYLQGSGLRIWPGQSGLLYAGHGQLWLAYPPRQGLDSHLVTDLKLACDTLALRLWINSTDGGQHVIGSRHYRGLAVDIDQIAPATKAFRSVTIDNHEARMLVRYLVAQGFKHYEQGDWPAVLLGPPFSEFNQTSVPHNGHLHISVWR